MNGEPDAQLYVPDNPQEKADNDSLSFQFHINVKWIPIVFSIILIIMIIVNYAMFDIEKGEWPTISRTASVFPMNRIFAVCMSCSGFIIFFYCNGVVDHLQLSGFSSAKYFKIAAVAVPVFLIAIGNCGMNDNLTAHNTLAGIGFLTFLVFPVLIFFGHHKIGILRYKIPKIVLAILTFVCLIPFVSLVGHDRHSKAAHALTVFEFITLFLLFILFLLNIIEFNEIKVDFKFGESEFDTSDLTKNLV